jgi:hypothetical protein
MHTYTPSRAELLVVLLSLPQSQQALRVCLVMMHRQQHCGTLLALTSAVWRLKHVLL